MTWFGTVSAVAALLCGLVIAAFAALQMSWGLTPWVVGGIAVALLVGGATTLGRVAGGLRVLAGAWGLTAGLMLQSYATLSPPPNKNSYSIDLGVFSYAVVALPMIALIGLALAVLQKESKA
jgi:hypothetical protein